MQRKSDSEKALAGTWRPDRAHKPVRRSPAKPPKPPKDASADVRAFYRAHAGELARRGILQPSDWPAFELCAESYAIAREAWRVVQREGFFRLDENDVQRRHPGIQVHRDALQSFAKLATRFGLTPKDRGERFALSEGEDLPLIDEFESFLRGRRDE